MLRIRFTLPRRKQLSYRNMDILHDALVNAWTRAGASSDQVTGVKAAPWNFAALGWRRKQENQVHTLVVSTPDTELSHLLNRLKPSDVVYARAATSEMVDFASAEQTIEPDPIPSGQSTLGVLLLSPLAISQPKKNGVRKRWHTNLAEVDLSASISYRLSRLAQCQIQLQVQPDKLYLRVNPRHDVLVPIKEYPGGKRAFVLGMKAPLVLSGSEDDLRFAWYAGLGEKTRSGFGCIGTVEQGVGRCKE